VGAVVAGDAVVGVVGSAFGGDESGDGVAQLEGVADVVAGDGVGADRLGGRIGDVGCGGGDVFAVRIDGCAVGTVEPEGFVLGVADDGVAAFVDGPVVVAAQQHEVVHSGGAVVGPVDDVVGVDPVGAPTAGEHAPTIADVQGPAGGPVDGAGLVRVWCPASSRDPSAAPMMGWLALSQARRRAVGVSMRVPSSSTQDPSGSAPVRVCSSTITTVV